MQAEKLNTLQCSKCKAESPIENKYCAECGNILPENKSDTESMKSVCPNCYAEFEADVNFCASCGTETTKIVAATPPNTCPRCYSEIASDLMYCPVCSSRIDGQGSSDKLCPNCLKEVSPGRPYCLACGTPVDAKKSYTTKIREKLKLSRESSKKTNKNKSILKPPSTRNDSTENGDNILEKEGENEKPSTQQRPQISWEEVNQIIKDEKQNDQKPGYLVCDICSDYYELKPGESPDDFIDECSCGGRLIHRIIKGK